MKYKGVDYVIDPRTNGRWPRENLCQQIESQIEFFQKADVVDREGILTKKRAKLERLKRISVRLQK